MIDASSPHDDADKDLCARNTQAASVTSNAERNGRRKYLNVNSVR